MPLTLKRSGSKASQQCTFTVHVHTLSPFPPGYGPLVIEWQRGSKRHGTMAPAPPTHLPGARGTAVQYRFDSGEPLHIPCTLRAVCTTLRTTCCVATTIPQDPTNAVSHYGFAKKVLCLAIAVANPQQHKKHLTRLGTVVLNLAECAGGDPEHALLLPVACVPDVTSVVKQPYLELTVQYVSMSLLNSKLFTVTRRKGGARGSSEGPSSQQGSSHAGWTSRHSDTTGTQSEACTSSSVRRTCLLLCDGCICGLHSRMHVVTSMYRVGSGRPPV